MVKPQVNTEVADHMNFDTIRYSQVWEDSQILTQGLNINNKDRVLSITSAGCNALSLLLKEPEQVTAVDLNPTQNAMLVLKLAAFQTLTYLEVSELLGFTTSHRVKELFQKIPSDKLGQFQEFWLKNQALLEGGLYKAGRLDAFFGDFARNHVAKLANIADLKKCFLTKNHPAQKKFLPVFKGDDFRKSFISAFGRAMLEKARDPAQFRYVTEDDVGQELYNRFIQSLETQDVYSNHYFYFFLFHEMIDCQHGPDYIQPKNYARLQRLHDRISVHTETIESALARAGSNAFTKANLSNIFEYMSIDNMIELLSVMHEKMPTGSRIAYWNLFVDRPMPKPLEKAFRAIDMNGCSDRVWFYKAFYVLERQ